MISKKDLLEFLKLEGKISRPDVGSSPTSQKSDKAIDEFSNKLDNVAKTLMQRTNKMLSIKDKKILYVMFYKFSEHQYFLGQTYADTVSGTTKPVSMQDIKKIDGIAKLYLKRYLESLKKIGVIYG